MCHICGKDFADEKVVSVHINSHSKEQIAKAEILEEISEADRRVAANRKPSAAAQPASPSPTPSEIATAEPVGNTPTVAELISSGHRVVDEQEGHTVLEVNLEVHADLGADL